MKKLYLNKNSLPEDKPKDQTPVDEKTKISQNQESENKKTNKEQQKENPMNRKKIKPTLLILSVAAILAGVGTGYGASRLKAKTSTGGSPTEGIQQVAQEGIKINKGDVFGVKDENTFKDRAEGYLEDGGINGEGSHKLLRPGGSTQTVYLTSSVTDLDKFVGMEIKIWGETFKGQKAGWLMDVGRVEVLDPNAEAPIEE